MAGAIISGAAGPRGLCDSWAEIKDDPDKVDDLVRAATHAEAMQAMPQPNFDCHPDDHAQCLYDELRTA
eukprot:1523358-Pyramimonas_sp.AAC.1